MADVVELKTGERVEGVVRGADSAAVRIEVGGQVLTFRPDQVRAIHYGTAPARSTEPSEALDALRALQAATSAGLTYEEYRARVVETQAAVDRFLAGVGGARPGPGHLAVAKAMDYYALGERAWAAQISRAAADYEAVGASPLIDQCAALQSIAGSRAETAQYPNEPTLRGTSVSIAGIPSIWSCASDRVAEAVRLLAGTP
jgi:hypothetical protein